MNKLVKLIAEDIMKYIKLHNDQKGKEEKHAKVSGIKDSKASRQIKKYDCGPAALRTVAKHYGIKVTQKELIKLCNATYNKGTKPNELVSAAKKLGLNARKVEDMTVDQLISLIKKQVPVICAIQAWSYNVKDIEKINDGHYVVAVGLKGNKIVFEDPALDSGKGYITKSEFNKRWIDREDGRNKPLYHLGIVITKD